MRSPAKNWRWLSTTLLLGAGLIAVILGGCTKRETKVYLPSSVEPASAEFGTAAALDLPPVSGSGAVGFDPSRYAAIGRGGDALIVYLQDDGTGTIRMQVVRYDNAQNPIVRYFNPPQTFDANSGSVLDARALLDDTGDGLIVWIQEFGSVPRLYASRYDGEAQSFSPPLLIDAGGENTNSDGVTGFDASLDTAGNGIIAFYENVASPGLSEVFGVYYDKAAESFSAPDKCDLYSEAGHDVASVKTIANEPGKGYVLIRQDADAGAPIVYHCSASRFSSESSLSAFNAVTRVNPPGYDDPVRDMTGVMLPGGDALFLFEQDDPDTGYSRIYSRRYLYADEAFEASIPLDLAPQAAAENLDFEAPVVVSRPDGATIALFRSGGATPNELHANIYDQAGFVWNTTSSTVLSASGASAGPVYLAAFSSSGDAEVVFTQSMEGQGLNQRVFATRFIGSLKNFTGVARPCDVGAAEKGVLSTLPLTYDDPVPVGAGFDRDGRFLVAFTGSDGLMERLYVNRGLLSDPTRFEGARAVDGSARSSVFATTQTLSDVVSGDAVFLIDPSGYEGLALWRQQEIVGANTTVRLFGNAYHGYNLEPGASLSGTQLIDEDRETSSNRPVRLYDAATTATGSVTAIVQDAGGTDELYIRAYADHTAQFDLTGLGTQDNGTTGAIHDVIVLEGDSGDAFVLFLQDDAGGDTRVYGRLYDQDLGFVSPVGGLSQPLSGTGSGLGDVTDMAAVSVNGAALLVYRQEENASHAVFGLKIDAQKTVTGPVRLSDVSAVTVSAPIITAASTGAVLVAFIEDLDLVGRITTDITFGQAVSGSPTTIDAASGVISSFDADADGWGAFVVVFDQSETAGGKTVRMRRNAYGTWDGSVTDVSATGGATLDHASPEVSLAGNGKGVIAYKVTDSSLSPADVSLMAAVFDPYGSTPLSTPQVVDNDGSVLLPFAVDAYDIALDPPSGRGLIFFTQDADATATTRNRVFHRGFDLANAGTGSAVFHVNAVDMSEGGASTQTEVTFFNASIGPDGSGFLVHGERVSGSGSAKPAYLVARRFEPENFNFDAARVASRLLTDAAGSLSSEAVDSAKVVHTADGRAFLLHTITQTDSVGPTTYRRLFANIYR